jgi:hypothetical protein
MYQPLINWASKILFAPIFAFFLLNHSYSQNLNAEAYTNVLVSSNSTPFLIISNNNGRYAKDQFSADFGFSASYTDTLSIFEYQLGSNLSYNSAWNKLNIHSLYGIASAWWFKLSAGYHPYSAGLIDTTLSLGGTIFSSNAPIIPRISLASNGWINVPFTKGYVKINGLFEHGWFEKGRYVEDVRLHHKNFFVQVGGDLPVNLSAGLVHAVQWGGISPDPVYGDMTIGFEEYINYIVRAKNPDSIPGLPTNEHLNRLGNHLGSWNYALQIKPQKYLKFSFYYHTIFEDKSGFKRKFNRDGKFTFALENTRWNAISKFTFEYLHTKYQSGPEHILDSLSGNDNYFNNYLYRSGWTVDHFTLGTPYITSPYIVNGINTLPNNRVESFALSLKGSSGEYRYLVRYAYVLNFGRHSAAYIPEIKQSHWLFELNRTLTKGIIHFTLSGDIGSLFGNSVGFACGYSHFLIKK